MALTGGVVPNGRAARLAMQIWAKNTDAKGGLLGLDVNAKFYHPDYFSIAPTGGLHSMQSISEGFFALAAALQRKHVTIAMTGTDAQFAINAMHGVRELARQYGLRIIYDRTYPPYTVDYGPIVQAIQATQPDIVLVASYPPDSVTMIRAAREIGLKTRVFGGAMVGPQATAIKIVLGPLLNRVTTCDFWPPVGAFATPEAMAFLKQYPAVAKGTGVDELGYDLPPFAKTDLQMLAQAVEGTNGFGQEKLAASMRSRTFHTVVGDITFGPGGERLKTRVLQVQFQGVTGHSVAQFANPKREVILWPEGYNAGTLHPPYNEAEN